MLQISTAVLSAGEFFVSKQGNDNNDGLSIKKAFATIQKGVNALTPGDILTIEPGEYSESVKRKKLGSMKKETVIRAAIPGTVLLRGDIPAPKFKKVKGYRFVYSAPFDREPRALLEVDTLQIIGKRPSIPAIDFEPGTFYYDSDHKMLYMSSSDMLPPSQHLYRVSITSVSGLWLVSPQRVIIDGISASGYHTTRIGWHKYGVWGIRLDQPVACVIRKCTAYMNGGGITLWGRGHGNIIEYCVAYANYSQFASEGGNIIRYGGNDDIIKNCLSFKTKRKGISFYGRGQGPVLLKNNICWGNGLIDFRIKAHGTKGAAIAENCVAMGNGMVKNIRNSLVGKNGYLQSGMPIGNIKHKSYRTTKYHEFADPDNLDFRLQSTSKLRKAGKDGRDLGPFPYQNNIFYVSPDGNDMRDGTSLKLAWKTLKHALKNLKSGDTLYLEPGVYNGDITISKKNINIRGRKIKPVRIAGNIILDNCSRITLERLNFSGNIIIKNSDKSILKNCTFDIFNAVDNKSLNIYHCIFSKTPSFSICKQLDFRGNIYAKGIKLDNSQLKYSDYNSYSEKKFMLHMPDNYSQLIEPKIIFNEKIPEISNIRNFKGLGPNGTSIGIYTPYRKETIRLAGPFIHSKSETTMNIELWTSFRAKCEIAWGETPQCEKTKIITVHGFGNFSLTGLKPGKKYYIAVRSVKPAKISYNLTVKDLKPKFTPLAVTTLSQATAQRTWYVACDGDDSNNGLSRAKAFKTINRGAKMSGVGDTVLIAGGTYPETVIIRATGSKKRPITFKAIPGEKVVMSGGARLLSKAFVASNKHYLRFDGFYLKGHSNDNNGWGGIFYLNQSDNIRISRCFMDGRGPGNPWNLLYTNNCQNILVKNCVIFNSFYGMYIVNSSLRIENSLIIRSWITALMASGKTLNVLLKNCVITDSQPFKVNIQLFDINRSEKFHDENNCYYLRRPDDKRKMFIFYADEDVRHLKTLKEKRISLAEYRKKVRPTKSFIDNPWFKATVGMRDERRMGKYAREIVIDQLLPMSLDFNDLFVTNPVLIKRGIGLQTEAFKDFKFKKKTQKKHMVPINELIKKSKNAESSGQKDDFLSQAALLASKHKEYNLAMNLAEKIQNKPLSKRIMLEILYSNKRFSTLIKKFKDEDIELWPKNSRAKSYQFRAYAYIKCKNGEAAEADLNKIIELGEQNKWLAMLYRGNNYLNILKDERKAADCLKQLAKEGPKFYWVTGDGLTKAVALLSKQKRFDEALQLLKRYNIDKLKGFWQARILGNYAKIYAAQGKKAEAVATYQKALAIKGLAKWQTTIFQKEIKKLK